MGTKSTISWPGVLDSSVNGRGLVEEANKSEGVIVAGYILEGIV